jgi:hypothetical protein
MWITNGRRFHVKLAQFAQILWLSSLLDIPKKLHSGRVMMPRETTPMYVQAVVSSVPRLRGCFLTFLCYIE